MTNLDGESAARSVDDFRPSDYRNDMVTNLHDAQSSLGHLVQLASEGEEVVITVDGRPAARLTCIATTETSSFDRKQWAEELSAAAQAARVGDCQSTPQSFWDEIREERI